MTSVNTVQRVFVQFAPYSGPGFDDRVVELDRYFTGINQIGVSAYSYRIAAPSAQTAVLVDIRELSMNITQESQVGYPLPTITRGKGPGPETGGEVFAKPWIISNANKPSLQRLTIRLRAPDGSPFVHQGFSLWLVMVCGEKKHDLQESRLLQWITPEYASGAGQFGDRFGWVPSEEQMQQHMRQLEQTVFSANEMQ